MRRPPRHHVVPRLRERDAYNVFVTFAVVNRHSEYEGIAETDVTPPPAREQIADRRVRLTAIDKLALDALVDPRDVPALTAIVEASATALAGPDRNEARLRLVSRAVASQRARMLVLEGLLDEHLAAGKMSTVAEIDKLLLSTTKRLSLLLAEHRAACSAGHRATVVVGHADSISVEGGR